MDWTLNNLSSPFFFFFSVEFSPFLGGISFFFFKLLLFPGWGFFYCGVGEAVSSFVDLQEFSIAKVATEDGSGFGGDCRGSR